MLNTRRKHTDQGPQTVRARYTCSMAGEAHLGGEGFQQAQRAQHQQVTNHSRLADRTSTVPHSTGAVHVRYKGEGRLGEGGQRAPRAHHPTP